MEQIDFLGKGIKFPIRTDTSLTYVENEACIEQSIKIILGTVKGERVMRPDFGCGIHELTFTAITPSVNALVVQFVKDALNQWEPRIVVGAIKVSPGADNGFLEIDIEYTIKSMNSKKNLVYPFYLEGKK